MSFVSEHQIGLLEKLRISERLASHIIMEGQIHAEPRHLKRALDSDGSTTQAVLKNWIYGLIESRPEIFQDREEAERFVQRAFREKILEAFPGACNL